MAGQDDPVVFENELETALAVLRNGGVILYPTDTIWGLGCDATNAAAIKKIYQIKQRAESKSLILLIADERDILQYIAAPDPAVFDYIQEQDRPTTIIFDGAIGLPDNLIAEDGTIALRLVQDDFCRHLVRRLRKPIVSTSANLSGEPSPANFSTISVTIKSSVDHIVRWRQTDQQPAKPSRIVRWKEGEVIVVRE
jgi:L-threonylcarbamoyladenylate synthase